jgi:hypothetical protein
VSLYRSGLRRRGRFVCLAGLGPVAFLNAPLVELDQDRPVFRARVGMVPAPEGALHVLAIRVGRVAVAYVLRVLAERAAIFALSVGGWGS